MDDTLFGVKDLDVYVVLGILVFFGLMEVIAGYLARTQRSRSDWIQEVGSFFALSQLIKPTIIAAIYFAGRFLFPEYLYVFSEWSLLVMLPFYLLIDDVMQYWYHRSAHEYEWLWKLHRPHHQAEEMGFFVSYRNAALYYVIMPNLWWVAIVIFLGGAKAVALGLILKQLVIIGSHSTIHWDAIFYKYNFLNPVITLLERIIITPAFHHGHHGKSMADNISDPNGNYGNMFSIWDQLFGTAKFTRQFPTELGLVNDPKDSWQSAYLYPIFKSDKPGSNISKDYKKEKTTSLSPSTIELKPNTTYLFCQCGFSQNQPFCDGAHHGTKFKPKPFEVKRNTKARLCNCKLSKSSPFCDDSHLGKREQ